MTAKHCIDETEGSGYIVYGTESKSDMRHSINFTRSDVIFNQFGYVDVVIIKTQKKMQLVGIGQDG